MDLDRFNVIVVSIVVAVVILGLTALGKAANDHADNARVDRTRTRVQVCKTIENETARIICVKES